MEVTNRIIRLTAHTLEKSMDVQVMECLIKAFIPSYDLKKRLRVPGNASVHKSDAAKQIVTDVNKTNRFLQFLLYLIDIYYNGFMGKKYQLINFGDVIQEVGRQGLMFDREAGVFIEDPGIRRTRNWGCLNEGEEYLVTVLHVDMVRSSELGKKNNKKKLDAAYEEVRSIIENAVNRRNGRVWNIKGDGILAAFYFSNKHLMAVLSGIEILNEMFIYNTTRNELKSHLDVRIGIHSGTVHYYDNAGDLYKNEIIQKAIEIEEKLALPNSVTVSNVVEVMLDPIIANCFSKFTPSRNENNEYYRYQIMWEN